MQLQETFKALEMKGEELVLIDQRLLPTCEQDFICRSSEDVFHAIRDMVVRGAPAIGGVAGYGVWFAARQARGDMDLFDRLCAHLVDARPTAVNLEWAVRRVSAVAKATSMDLDAIRSAAASCPQEPPSSPTATPERSPRAAGVRPLA